MKPLRLKAALATAAAVSLASLAAGAPASASGGLEQGTDSAVTTSHALTQNQVDAVRDFWTDDKLKVETSDKIDSKTLPPPAKVLTPNADRLGYARPGHTYASRSTTRAVGKIVMMNGDSDSNCSGAAIGGDLILTAAHCLVDPTDGSQTTNLAFIPSFFGSGITSHKPVKPYGVWPVEKTYMPTEYANKIKGKGDYNPYDIAIMKVASNPDGKTLQDVVKTTYKWTQSESGAPRFGETVGYPGQGGPKFNRGPEMFYCLSELKDDGVQPLSEMQANNCAVQGGNSGGPVFDSRWNIVAVTQSGTQVTVGGHPAEYSTYARLAPETFGRMLKEAQADSE